FPKIPPRAFAFSGSSLGDARQNCPPKAKPTPPAGKLKSAVVYILASKVANFEVSSSLGCTLANSSVAALDGIGRRKSLKGLKATVVPMNCGEVGSKIGSAWFKIRLNR